MVNLRTCGGSTAETKSEQSPSFVAARTTVRRFAYRPSTVIGASLIFGLPSRPSTGSPRGKNHPVVRYLIEEGNSAHRDRRNSSSYCTVSEFSPGEQLRRVTFERRHEDSLEGPRVLCVSRAAAEGPLPAGAHRGRFLGRRHRAVRQLARDRLAAWFDAARDPANLDLDRRFAIDADVRSVAALGVARLFQAAEVADRTTQRQPRRRLAVSRGALKVILEPAADAHLAAPSGPVVVVVERRAEVSVLSPRCFVEAQFERTAVLGTATKLCMPACSPYETAADPFE